MKNHTNSIINLKDGTISIKTDKDEVKFSCSYGIADINSDSSDDIEDKVLLLVENAEELGKEVGQILKLRSNNSYKK